MKPENTFTKKDIIVVLSCIIFLLANIAAVGEGGRNRAKEAVCLSNLLKWGQILHAYTADNDGYFYTRKIGTPEGYKKMWIQVLQPYYKDPMMRCCPAAANPYCHTGPFSTWGGPGWDAGKFGSWVQPKGVYGSYAMSRHVLNMDAAQYPFNWRRADVKGADKIPVFLDGMYVYSAPAPNNDPPDYNGDWTNDMKCVCIDRHGRGSTNVLFLDWSARRVGLKQLWTFKWNRNWNTCDIWTKCGGVQPTDWPEWMRDFEDY